MKNIKNRTDKRERCFVMSTLLSNDTMIIAEPERIQAESILNEACDRPLEGLSATIDGKSFSIPPDLSSFLVRVIEHAATGSAVRIITMPQELTTTEAATMLGVSRPTLVKFIDSGALVAKKVGSHSRLKSDDVIAFRLSRETARNVAFQELREIADALGEE